MTHLGQLTFADGGEVVSLVLICVCGTGEARAADRVGDLSIVACCNKGLGIRDDVVKKRTEFDLPVNKNDQDKISLFLIDYSPVAKYIRIGCTPVCP